MVSMKISHKPINRSPRGKTKANLLIYILNNDEPSFTDIKKYLRQNLHINSENVLRKHLAELVSNNLIDKNPHGSGFADTFTPNYDNFNQIYHFLEKQGLNKEFMDTKYYAGYLRTKQFRDYIIALNSKFEKDNRIREADIQSLSESDLEMIQAMAALSPSVIDFIQNPKTPNYPMIRKFSKTNDKPIDDILKPYEAIYKSYLLSIVKALFTVDLLKGTLKGTAQMRIETSKNEPLVN